MIILITNLTLNMSSKRDCENYILRLMRVIVTPIGVEFGDTMFRERKTTALLNWVPSQLFPKHTLKIVLVLN